ncbi:MAG TPA: BatA and WFA domain-containing protein [Candidatus Limnocylindrales bacterium]|nr:BatA and WFA domain-containing protein [Candidatus Limnocylindrales bacterium]
MIAPLALVGLLALPVIVAFYMLRLRRRDLPVGSTFLWQQLIRDVEANAPWQKLRFSWLLLVQLLIAAIVVTAAARPFSAVESDLAANVVLIVDSSASMATRTDEEDRMALARERARDVVERLPVGGRITIVAAADTANVLVSETDDTDAALEAIDGITATQLPGDLTDAFALSSALAQRDADSTVVVVTDAAGDELPDVGVGAPVVVERIGSTDANQAIAALSALRRAGGAQLDLFVAVSNPSAVEATRRLEVYADGALVDARELTVPAGQRSEALVTTVPGAARLVEARLAGSDALLTDDRAFAVVPADETTRTLLVGAGNAYLENALALLPRLELYAVDEDGYTDALADAEDDGTPYGLLVFDGVVPDAPPDVPALYLDPDTDGTFGTVGDRVENPAIDRTDPDEPLLRFVDLTTVHIGRAWELSLVDGMRAVVETTRGDPLVAVGEVEGQRLGVIGFNLGESDLPLQVAFPLLMSNLTEMLLPEVEGILPSSMRLGESVSVTVDPRIERVTVVNTGMLDVPGSTSVGLDLSVVGGRLTIPGADFVGLREVRAVSEIAGLAGSRLGQTAINLFSADESDVAPGDPQRIIEMGRVTSTDLPASQPSRAEWWWPLALAALALLAVEWLLFHRPTRRSLGRALGRRPQPLGGHAR